MSRSKYFLAYKYNWRQNYRYSCKRFDFYPDAAMLLRQDVLRSEGRCISELLVHKAYLDGGSDGSSRVKIGYHSVVVLFSNSWSRWYMDPSVLCWIKHLQSQNMYCLVALAKIVHCIWQISQCMSLQEILKRLWFHDGILLVNKIAGNVSLSISAIVLIESSTKR